MSSRGALLAAVSLAFFPSVAPAVAQRSNAVPVLVGGDPDIDACNAVGLVTGLNPAGDGFLSVRAGPGTGFRELGRLRNGETAFMCDFRQPWIGIVYRGGRRLDCRVNSPINPRRAYAGPCRRGWVHGRFLYQTGN